MDWLIDTNIFLRLARRNDPDRQTALDAIATLKANDQTLCYTTQVLVEFWNVCTRPATARGGLGLDQPTTERKIRLLENRFRLLAESLVTHQEWKRLVSVYSVRGVQVHDAMLVAVMTAHNISHLLSFNDADFRRYGNITVINPKDIASIFPMTHQTN